MSEIKDNDVVICSAVRTPIGKFMGSFMGTSAVKLGSVAIASAIERAGLKPEQVDEVVMGCVLTGNLGQAPARQAALKAGLPDSSPATTVNKVCGSGLKAIMLAADGIALGNWDTAVAGGMECMSNAPFMVPTGRSGHKAGHTLMVDSMMKDGLEDAYEAGRSMGTFGEDTAQTYGFSREDQDQYALESVKRAQHAVKSGLFADEVVPVSVGLAVKATIVSEDEIPGKINPQKIPALPPAFRKDGTITAASSSANGDAAAAVVLTTWKNAKSLDLPVLARIRAHASFARKPAEFTLAPIGAIAKVLNAVGWKASDVDLYEINEAFAAVVMATMRDLGIEHSKVNINGGACALGHPIGASGARVLVTLIHALRAKDMSRGIASLCIGGGEAVAMAIELV